MTKNKYYSLWLCGICIFIFILQIILSSFGFTEMFLPDKSALDGEYWRFLTAIFLHGGIIHLFYNLFALFFFGLSLEKIIGSRKFLFVFLFSGIIANVVSVYFYPSSLGASGAIMGVIGCLTIINPLMLVWAFGLIMPMFIAAALWITGDVLGALGAFGSTNIGNMAHLSGVGVGILVGLLFRGLGVRKT